MGGPRVGGRIRRRRTSLAPYVWADLGGAALFVFLCLVTLAASRGDRSRMLMLLLGIAGTLALGRIGGSVYRAVVPAVVAVIALPVAVGAAFWDGVGALPGYRATALTLAVIGMIAAAMVAAGAIRFHRSTVVAPGWTRAAIGAVALAFVAVLATTIALGATYSEEQAAVGVGPPDRVALWHAALEILSERPTGVGPGRFDDVPPRFLPEGDVRSAEHDILQQGAELGWAGLILTILLFLWGFARLWLHPAPDAYVALGAVALAVLGIAACMTHVLHVPVVALVTAALVGSAQSVDRDVRLAASIE